jgi:hypothetical protein
LLSILPKGLIPTIAVEDAVNMLSEANYGIHCLVVYPDLTTVREFYSHYIQKQIEVRNEVVQMAPFYETVDSVRQIISKSLRALDVERLESEEKTLVIVDSFRKYFDHDEYVKFDLDVYKRMVDYAKTVGKSGCSILGDMGAFHYEVRIHDLVEYEMSLPTWYDDVDMKGICLYHQQDFNRLAPEQKEKLAMHHSMAIRIVPHK